MARKTVFIVGVSLLLAALLHGEAAACYECGCNNSGYRSNERWGWYGARKSVPSAEEARRDLTDYYSDSGAKIGKITDKSTYFEAEIFGNDKKLMDRVVIHKRSGRIRSIK